MDILREILIALSSSCSDTKTLCKKLGVSETEISAALTILKAHGYIEEAKGVDPCARCPLRRECLDKPPKIYIITEKGLRLIHRKT